MFISIAIIFGILFGVTVVMSNVMIMEFGGK